MKSQPEPRISELLAPAQRYVRSANLERDFRDASALSGYVLTDFSRECLQRISSGLNPRSGQRAWRVTGDYGSGKSSFALLLAHTLAGSPAGFPANLRKAADVTQFGVPRPNCAPVLVTCSRQSLGISILAGLDRTLTDLYQGSSKPKSIAELQRRISGTQDPTEEETFRLIQDVNTRLIAEGKAKGLLLILDELGKFLEFAALHPQRQDVYLLQRLAETASRSGDKPLFVVCLLHQAFYAYSDTLNQSAQREWEKIAGRFEEIVFNQPVEQIAQVIASALNVQVAKLPKLLLNDLTDAMERTADLGWFGSASTRSLKECAAALYPLHPTVLPVLIRIFRRFGQNERSLFSFLLSNEPCGLQAFAEKRLSRTDVFRLHDLYDYVRTNFGHRLGTQSYRSHWNLIDSLIESFATENAVHVNVLKTVGILNLLNDGDLIATEESIGTAIGDLDRESSRATTAAVAQLRSEKRALWDRGRSRGLCLWPHTSVDLEAAYEKARRALGTTSRVAHLITDLLETRPIVARRHYIETGNLRHFDVRYTAIGDLSKSLDDDTSNSDGVILVPLCETVEERAAALDFVKRPELRKRKHWFVAVPQPLSNLASLVQEVQRWEWVSTHTLELNADKYAREEVSRQKRNARAQLERRLQSYIGLKQLTGQMTLEWYQEGKARPIQTGRQLLEHLSTTCDQVYSASPKIHNELVNRRTLSSAAAAARGRLIKLMLTEGRQEWMGLDPTKKPPEMSIYLSVLRNTGMHHPVGDSWRIGEPTTSAFESSRITPSLCHIRDSAKAHPDGRINVASLFEELRRAPFGVRDGLLPLLLAAFAIEHEKDVAFYKDGTFLRELDAETMLVLTKAPERFDLQYCKIEGVRSEIFDRLVAVLEVKRTERGQVELLDLVKTLCVFVAQLPAYVHNTKRLNATTLAVRDAILAAREPARLVFADLPKACGFSAFAPDATTSGPVVAFVKALKAALDELRVAFPLLQERIRHRLREAFELPGSSFQQFRTALAARAEGVLVGVTELKLRAFCLRLIDDNLPESDWIESIGSYLALKPPAKWHDAEEDLFNGDLAANAARFHRVESIVFAKGQTAANTIGVRLAVTQSSGVEHEEVLHFSPEEEGQVKELQRQFEALLKKEERLGLAAASRAIWTSLHRKKSNP